MPDGLRAALGDLIVITLGELLGWTIVIALAAGTLALVPGFLLGWRAARRWAADADPGHTPQTLDDMPAHPEVVQDPADPVEAREFADLAEDLLDDPQEPRLGEVSDDTGWRA